VSTLAARVRLPARGRRMLGVDASGALNLVGRLLKYFSGAFTAPLLVAAGYGDQVWPWLASGAITYAAGAGLERVTSGGESIGAREGFLVVALTWALVAWAVATPYMLAEPQLRNPVDAYFEAMSGITTTGSSAIRDLAAISKPVAFWRDLSQWLGGMGIVVLGLAILPKLRVAGRQLVESEAPGIEYEPLAATIRATARRLWLTYVGLSAAMFLILSLFGWVGIDNLMTEFQAATHMMGAMATGGFSPQPRSVEPFAAASQWVITVFMAIAGANFALHYRLLRKRMNPMRDEELRGYLVFLAIGTLILFLELIHANLFSAGEAAIRHAAFQTVSLMTTTGFASTDFNLWTSLAVYTLVLLMLIGGCAGSTGGAIKVVRVLLLGKLLRRELDQTVHREAVVPIRLNNRVVDERTLRAILAFGLLYLLIFILGALALLIEASRAGVEVTPFQAIASAATTLGNVGPSFGFSGPMGSFADFSPLGKAVMSMLMWLGRLEIIPVAILLTRRYWRA
jgi:trk system potassium uptake protein TrkH